MAKIHPITALEAEGERIFLSRLHSLLESDPIKTRDAFSAMMAVAFAANRLDARSLSDDMGYSFSTVYRWIEGRTAPHPSQWARIQNWVINALWLHIKSLRVSTSDLVTA